SRLFFCPIAETMIKAATRIPREKLLRPRRQPFVILVHQPAVSRRRFALVRQSQIVLAELQLQPFAQFQLDAAQRIDHLVFQQQRGLHVVAHERVVGAPQTLNRLIEAVCQIAILAQVAAYVFGLAQTFAQFGAELAAVIPLGRAAASVGPIALPGGRLLVAAGVSIGLLPLLSLLSLLSLLFALLSLLPLLLSLLTLLLSLASLACLLSPLPLLTILAIVLALGYLLTVLLSLLSLLPLLPLLILVGLITFLLLVAAL